MYEVKLEMNVCCWKDNIVWYDEICATIYPLPPSPFSLLCTTIINFAFR